MAPERAEWVLPRQHVARPRIAIQFGRSALEREFRNGTISEANLNDGVARIAALQGQLRAVHLSTHLNTCPLLSEQQIQHYNELRGYSPGSPQEHEHQHRQ